MWVWNVIHGLKSVVTPRVIMKKKKRYFKGIEANFTPHTHSSVCNLLISADKVITLLFISLFHPCTIIN